jgi:hypothetical protein
LSTDVSEARTASIIRDDDTSQKTILNITFTWSLRLRIVGRGHKGNLTCSVCKFYNCKPFNSWIHTDIRTLNYWIARSQIVTRDVYGCCLVSVTLMTQKSLVHSLAGRNASLDQIAVVKVTNDRNWNIFFSYTVSN